MALAPLIHSCVVALCALRQSLKVQQARETKQPCRGTESWRFRDSLFLLFSRGSESTPTCLHAVQSLVPSHSSISVVTHSLTYTHTNSLSRSFSLSLSLTCWCAPVQSPTLKNDSNSGRKRVRRLHSEPTPQSPDRVTLRSEKERGAVQYQQSYHTCYYQAVVTEAMPLSVDWAVHRVQADDTQNWE